VKNRGILLVLLLLIACQPTTGRAQSTPSPASDAWPEEPIAILIEHDPWAMVIGADIPRVSIYADGTVIRLEKGSPTRKAQLFVSQLKGDEWERVRKAIHPAESFWELRDEYNVAPNVTDLITTELVVTEDERFKRIQAYGYSAEAWTPPAQTIMLKEDAKSDSLPREFDRICLALATLKPNNERVWSPRYVEVMIWPYEYAPDESLEWPARWPNLTSPMAFQRGASYSLILPGSELSALEAFVARRGQRQAIQISGRKWAIAYRPVMPGGTWASEIAERQAMTTQH